MRQMAFFAVGAVPNPSAIYYYEAGADGWVLGELAVFSDAKLGFLSSSTIGLGHFGWNLTSFF